MTKMWKKIWRTQIVDPDTLEYIWRGILEDGRMFRVHFCPKCGMPLIHNSINELEGYHIDGCEAPETEIVDSSEYETEMKKDEIRRTHERKASQRV